MALRTFQSNPALGGFGGDSVRLEGDSPFEHDSSGDAFAQILKELVDNSVDSCRSSNFSTTSSVNDSDQIVKRRVRVRIQQDQECFASSSSQQEERSHTQPQQEDDSNAGSPFSGETGETTNREILRIEVVDNGCGMKDIQACVDPFFTSKAHNSTDATSADTRNSQQQQENTETRRNNSQNSSRSTSSTQNEQQTAGRYGIGLTLCLLHAQRLVPSTRTSITSATVDTPYWTEVTCVVDTEHDSIQCVSKAQIPKQPGLEDQSGTSVSLLLPGGAYAAAAWPRVTEYLKRFQLSLGLPCSIEVLAPTLSRIPIYIKPVDVVGTGDEKGRDADSEEIQQSTNSEGDDPPRVSLSPQMARQLEEESFVDLMSDPFASPSSPTPHNPETNEDDSSVGTNSSVATEPIAKKKPKDYETLRKLQLMAQRYLSRNVNMENIARVMLPIRSIKKQSTNNSTGEAGQEIIRAAQQSQNSPTASPATEIPQLEVSVTVYNTDSESDDEKMDRGPLDHDTTNDHAGIAKQDLSHEGASIALVRMVNSVPLLDSAQAVACGLVQGLNKRKLWQPFGLNAQLVPVEENTSPTKSPRFYAKDSDQVAPFFQNYKNHKHGRFQRRQTEEDDASGEEETYLNDDVGKDEEDDNSIHTLGLDDSSRARSTKSKRTRCPEAKFIKGSQDPSKWLCPAKERIGNMMVIVQVHANPKTLPLPTLCKGRLPLEDKAICTALEAGFVRCMRSLQKTNPKLFLTTQQLRRLERDVVLIPSMASALVSITSKSRHVYPIVQQYLEEVTTQSRGNNTNSNNDSDSVLTKIVEDKFRKAIKAVEESKTLRRKKARVSRSVDGSDDEETKDGYLEIDEFEGESQPCISTHAELGSLDHSASHSQDSTMDDRRNRFEDTDESTFGEL